VVWACAIATPDAGEVSTTAAAENLRVFIALSPMQEIRKSRVSLI
jgi:hypothetical protein